MNDTMIKLHFNLEPAEWHDVAVESLWAKRMPTDDGARILELQNSPFYAFGISYLDIVSAVEADGRFVFSSVVIPAGHSTYRLLMPDVSPKFEAGWALLSQQGCTYESGNLGEQHLFSVDVPPDADIHTVYRMLEEGEAQGLWKFEEGHCGHVIWALA